MLFLLTDSPQILKLEKNNGKDSPQLLVLLKTKKKQSSASDWWEYTKYCFKENAKVLFKDSTTQDLVLKTMLELFLKVPPLKKLEFQSKKKKTMKFL